MCFSLDCLSSPPKSSCVLLLFLPGIFHLSFYTSVLLMLTRHLLIGISACGWNAVLYRWLVPPLPRASLGLQNCAQVSEVWYLCHRGNRSCIFLFQVTYPTLYHALDFICRYHILLWLSSYFFHLSAFCGMACGGCGFFVCLFLVLVWQYRACPYCTAQVTDL